MTWPRDDVKLDRVRTAMGEHELDALVVRAPDNVLYLTNFWGMKGYDAVVFPREGDPVLICLEASEADAERTAWTSEVRLFHGYDESDPRPPGLRALDLARQLSSEYDRVGIELSLGTQATDRMVGEPTTYPKAWFDAFPDAADAMPLLNAVRAIKTEQEVERMRLANEIAARALEHTAAHLHPRMTESEAAAVWQGWVHGHGTGFHDRSSSRSASHSSGRAPGSGRSRRRATGRSARTSRRCSRSGSSPTATGATTRRTSFPGTSTGGTPSSSVGCWTSTPPRSTSPGPARASPSSTG